MMAHPPSFRLDGHVAGDHDASVEAHLETCESCRAYVEALAKPAAAFATRAEDDAPAFVARIEQRQAEPEIAHPRVPRVIPWQKLAARAAWIATPLLAAAAALLVVRGSTPQGELRPAQADDTFGTRFKGNVQLSIIRDRRGEQTRVSGMVSVLPGDRLRVEVGIDGEQPIVVGMLGNDGTWIVLLAPTLLQAGTHLSERSARFDDAPTEGVLLAGHPEAVERARMTRVFDRVTVVPVVREP
jgi:predicted anti-sigma-YlaC factor YlaD